MRYYILTTTKFAEECIGRQVYGSTNSNWLANIKRDDVVFLSQFNYKSQNIFGPFKVTKPLYYDKTIIYPNQRYYYRIKIKPLNLKIAEEVDIYLGGIKSKSIILAYGLINLIQQNKHLHAISLTNHEGKFISKILSLLGKRPQINCKKISLSNQNDIDVDVKFIADKNKLYKKKLFASESDLETFIIFSLNNKKNDLFKKFSQLLSYYPDNNLGNSHVYNQFIFGNAYPADIVVINTKNINIFELKKNPLGPNLLPAIEKEMRKHCYYSLFSSRISPDSQPRMNFYLLVLKDKKNLRLKTNLINEFRIITKSINKFRENNFIILEYYVEKNQLFFEKL